MSTSIERRANLNCTAYQPYKDESYQYNETIVQDMVYWQDIPTDKDYLSPFYYHHDFDHQQPKYITFELDIGGWNNVRMAFETVLVMAHAMGRTLVLPPQQEIYLLSSSKTIASHNVTNVVNLSTIFSLQTIQEQYKGINIITMEEFLQTEAMNGNFYNRDTKEPSYPPYNRTNWDNMDCDELYQWLESDGKRSIWNHEGCVAVFSSSSFDSYDNIIAQFTARTQNGTNIPSYEQYIGHPTRVYDAPMDRLMEQINGRRELCSYTRKDEKERVIHFVGGRNVEDLHNGRLLSPFYAFLFFENWKQDVWVKRFIRDAVRYNDPIQCAAARVVTAIRAHARQQHHSNTNGYFDAFHVRRGEFQYKKTKITSEEMYTISSDIIPDGSTVYIATDLRKKNRNQFFHALSEHYDLMYLDDFLYLLDGIDPNLYGMIEQLIVSQSRIFFGCWFSTFTSYINRIRGYHTDMKKQYPGYQSGIIPSYYYALPEHKMRMQQYWPISGMVYAREFPVSWRNIDQGIPTD